MSHSSSRKRALDPARPLAHRASHARSCVNHVANRLGITRYELLTKVEEYAKFENDFLKIPEHPGSHTNSFDTLTFKDRNFK